VTVEGCRVGSRAFVEWNVDMATHSGDTWVSGVSGIAVAPQQGGSDAFLSAGAWWICRTEVKHKGEGGLRVCEDGKRPGAFSQPITEVDIVSLNIHRDLSAGNGSLV